MHWVDSTIGYRWSGKDLIYAVWAISEVDRLIKMHVEIHPIYLSRINDCLKTKKKTFLPVLIVKNALAYLQITLLRSSGAQCNLSWPRSIYPTFLLAVRPGIVQCKSFKSL